MNLKHLLQNYNKIEKLTKITKSNTKIMIRYLLKYTLQEIRTVIEKKRKCSRNNIRALVNIFLII